MEMSEDIYANVEATVDSKADIGDHDSTYEEIYENQDNLQTRDQRTRKVEQFESSVAGVNSAGNKYYRVTAVCVLLLCVLLLSAIAVLWIKFSNLSTENNQLQSSYYNLTSERDQLQTKYNTLTIEKDQLQTNYNTLTIERDQLQTNYNTLTSERDQLQTNYNTLTKEKDQLQTNYNTLTIERDQLQTNYNTLTSERDQLQTKYNTLTKEKDQLQTNYNTLTIERDQLQTNYNTLTSERDQLQTNYNTLTNEKDQLQTNYNTLTIERDQFQKQKDGLQKNGWIFFTYKFYYISTKKKNWTESRQDCIEKGLDLVIINSKEEQDFVTDLTKSKNPGVYIGLTDRDTEGVWKWVDGPSMTTKHWSSGNGFAENGDCVVIGYNGDMSGWFDRPCTEMYYWICE